MTDDTGFAPNPFHGILTIANCKPLIRLKKEKLDFIAGFTSKKMSKGKFEKELLVYIMKVTEKLSYSEYFNDPRFQCKIPTKKSLISIAGDNIYEPSPMAAKRFIQKPNPYHNDGKDMDHDLKGKYVLISDDFFYFGRGAIPIDIDLFQIKIPKFQSGHGVKTANEDEVIKLWKYLSDKHKKNVVLFPPDKWKENEPFNNI